jgi:hypothetical protein
MTTNKNSASILDSAFIGVMLVLFAGIALLFVIVNELDESGWAVPNFMQAYLSFREALRNNTGNEFTGEATAWFFGLASVPVFADLTSRLVTRYMSVGGTVKSFLRHANSLQKKHLMPLHTWFSVAALGLGILHLTLSSCIANPFPELGLILTGILVITGLLFKCRAVPGIFRKILYKFHASLIVSGVLLVILFAGHAVMDLD